MDFLSSLFMPGTVGSSSDKLRHSQGYGPVTKGSTLGMQRSNFRAEDEEMAQQNFASTVGGIVQILAFMNAMKTQPGTKLEPVKKYPRYDASQDPAVVNPLGPSQNTQMMQYLQMFHPNNGMGAYNVRR